MAAKVDQPFGKDPVLPEVAAWKPTGLPTIGVARLLSAAVVVLFLLFGGFLWWEYAQALRAATNLAGQITQALSDSLGRGLHAANAVLDRTIEQLRSAGLEGASGTALRAELLSVTARVPFISAIRLVGPDDALLAEVLYEAAPKSLPLSKGPESSRLRLADGTLIGRLSGGENPAIVMSRSFAGPRGASYDLVIALEVAYFSRLLPGEDRGASYNLLVFDEEGRRLFEVPSGSSESSSDIAPYLLDRLAGRAEAVLSGGKSEITVVQRLSEQPLYVAVGLPLHAIQLKWASSGWPIWGVAFAAVLLLAVVLLLAARQAREQERLSRSLVRLNESLETRVRLRTQELERLLEEREQVSNDLAQSLKQKDVLFREVHHRVKNNLQVINSLISLQAGRASAELRPFLEESRRRLHAMRRLHEQLYQRGDGTALDLGAYLSTLAEEMIRSFGAEQRVRLSVEEVEPVKLSLDQATPVALIATEVLSNALKYAFPREREGRIALRLREEDGTVRLEIRDDGVGLPRETKGQEGQGLGRMLVRVLAKQLRGQAEYRGSDAGTRFWICFPKAASIGAEELEAAQ